MRIARKIAVPIYEFYCVDCHMIFNFLSRTVNTTKRPKCPRCGRPKLDRQVSRFAISKNRPEPGSEGDDDLPPGFDETKFEQAMEELSREAEGLDEENPRQMARLMRKLFASTGMEMNDRMEEAMRRMEGGEDPDALEEEFGDLFDEEGEMPFEMSSSGGKIRSWAKKLRRPEIDDTLYEM